MLHFLTVVSHQHQITTVVYGEDAVWLGLGVVVFSLFLVVGWGYPHGFFMEAWANEVEGLLLALLWLQESFADTWGYLLPLRLRDHICFWTLGSSYFSLDGGGFGRQDLAIQT
ncbi:hypothetical protein U1Q18_018325 [Sarracenia purpurea var. burkii]